MFFSDEQLGPRQSLLPSGTLWCRDVVVARTGEQRYAPHEIGADDTVTDGDGMIRVMRDASEVFDPRAMSSFEGAPVVLSHPDTEVAPSNWRDLAVGHMQNIRRGEPPDDDKLIADLLIHDQRAIRAVRDLGWRAVSLGYQADYKPDGPGRMRQVGIRGNHCAILSPQEDARCGDACVIGDSVPRRKPKMQRDQQPPLQFAGSAELTPEATPHDPRSGIFGAQEAGGPSGIALSRDDCRRIAAADAARSRAALRSINEHNRRAWAGR